MRLDPRTPRRSLAFNATAALALSACAAFVTAGANADSTGLLYHSTSKVVDGQTYFVIDVFVGYENPCDRLLLYWNTIAQPYGLSSGFWFQTSAADIPATARPSPGATAIWDVDTFISIGGDTQRETKGCYFVTPDWDDAFTVSSAYQPGCMFIVPPLLGYNFAGSDRKVHVGRFTIHESQYLPGATLHFSARFGSGGQPGNGPWMHDYSIDIPFQLTPAGSTTDAHDEPSPEPFCYSPPPDNGGGSGSGGSSGGGGTTTPPPGVANLNPSDLDFNGDGNADLMWFCSINGQTSHWQMDGLSRIGGGGFAWAAMSNSVALGAGDSNDDGTPEAFFFQPYGRWVFMWTFVGTQRLSAELIFTENSGWTPVAVGDFTGDGRADVLSRSSDGLNYRARPIAYRTVYAARNVATVAAGFGFVAAGDFDGNGVQDLLLRATNGVYWVKRLGVTGAATMLPITAGALATEWRMEGVGDLDGDRDDDIVWHNTVTGEVRGWLMQDGVRQTGGAIRTGVGASSKVISILDTDHDGRADVIWRNEATGDVYAWKMNGLVRENGAFVRNVSTVWSVVNR